MKTSAILLISLLALNLSFAADTAKEQEAVALQIEELINFDGEITVLSLDPSAKDNRPLFHRFTVLGSARINKKSDREKLLRALSKSTRESSGDPYACFVPRHGLRFVKDGRQKDIVICFECHSSRSYGFGFGRIFHSSSAQSLFDKFLKDNGIELAKKSEAE